MAYGKINKWVEYHIECSCVETRGYTRATYDVEKNKQNYSDQNHYYDTYLNPSAGVFSKRDAEKALKELGWKYIKGLWYCPKCVKEKENQNGTN